MRCQFSMAADQRIRCDVVIGPRTSGVISSPTFSASNTGWVAMAWLTRISPGSTCNLGVDHAKQLLACLVPVDGLGLGDHHRTGGTFAFDHFDVAGLTANDVAELGQAVELAGIAAVQ